MNFKDLVEMNLDVTMAMLEHNIKPENVNIAFSTCDGEAIPVDNVKLFLNPVDDTCLLVFSSKSCACD